MEHFVRELSKKSKFESEFTSEAVLGMKSFLRIMSRHFLRQEKTEVCLVRLSGTYKQRVERRYGQLTLKCKIL